MRIERECGFVADDYHRKCKTVVLKLNKKIGLAAKSRALNSLGVAGIDQTGVDNQGMKGG